MRGFVLAAGLGTRLRPVTEHVPKALVPVAGRPLLERALSFLVKEGITEVGVNAHYRYGELAAYRKRSPYPFRLFHERDFIRGTGGALRFAREFLAGDELFFTCNVDILLDLSLGPAVDRFLSSGWLAGLLAVPAEGSGAVYHDLKSGAYRGVPADGPAPDGAVPADFIGATLYRREFLDFINEDDRSVVPVWKRVGEKTAGVGVLDAGRCFWRDIGTPEALAGIHFEVLDGNAGLDVPPELCIDRAMKRCFRRDLPERLRPCIGEYSWVEAAAFPAESGFSRCVVFEGADLQRTRKVERMIITPFCEVPFGN